MRVPLSETILGMKIKYHTVLFGKAYIWCEDIEGKTVLVKTEDDGEIKVL